MGFSMMMIGIHPIAQVNNLRYRRMKHLVPNGRVDFEPKTLGSQSLSTWSWCCCWREGQLGERGGLIYLLSLSFNFCSHPPPWGFPSAPPSKHFENQIFESCRQLPWVRLPGGHFHLHRFSEPFRGPDNPVTQCRACPLLLPLPSCHKSEQLLTHRLLLPLWLPTLTCHLQLFLLWIHTHYTMSFSLSNSPGTWHFLLLMLPWLSMTHQNLPALRVELADPNGLTSLIFLIAVIQTF